MAPRIWNPRKPEEVEAEVSYIAWLKLIKCHVSGHDHISVAWDADKISISRK